MPRLQARGASRSVQQATLKMAMHPSEVVAMGDYAYERGTYELTVTDKATGKVLQDVRNNDVHIFRRQADGAWKTWRMLVSSAPK
jgi:ketosteroid isomerase-like protein